jgi:hypothetical protein
VLAINDYWGTAAFKHFFKRIVWQCVAAGLVDVMTEASRRISLPSKTAKNETAGFLKRYSPMTRKTTSTSVPQRRGYRGPDTAAIQNIMILVRYVKEPGEAIPLAIKKTKDKWLNLRETSLPIITGKGYLPRAGCF